MTEPIFCWTKQKEMESKAHELLVEKKIDEAEKFLLKALEADDDNPIDRHFVYNHLIELYYKIRNEREDALEKCVYFCKVDIESLPEFLHDWRILYPPIPDLPEETSLPQCRSIERLAISYEKNGKYQEAIDLCKYAIELGLESKWDSYNARYAKNKGYKARMQKLEKFIENSKNKNEPL
jgi:tetratricopeptide (TPR) repeat protein